MGSDPERSIGISRDGVHDVVDETIGFGKSLKAPVLEPVHAGLCSEPKHALRIFIDRPDRIAREAICFGVGGEFTVAETREAAAVGTDPEIIVVVYIDHLRLVRLQSRNTFIKHGKTNAIEADQTLFRA